MSEEEYKDYLQLSGKITEKLDNTAVYENWLIIQEYIDRAQQKVEQLENIRKEAIEFMKENCDIITIDKGWIIRSELTTTGLGKLFKILNKGSEKE
jgi:hypothetical protein